MADLMAARADDEKPGAAFAPRNGRSHAGSQPDA